MSSSFTRDLSTITRSEHDCIAESGCKFPAVDTNRHAQRFVARISVFTRHDFGLYRQTPNWSLPQYKHISLSVYTPLVHFDSPPASLCPSFRHFRQRMSACCDPVLGTVLFGGPRNATQPVLERLDRVSSHRFLALVRGDRRFLPFVGFWAPSHNIVLPLRHILVVCSHRKVVFVGSGCSLAYDSSHCPQLVGRKIQCSWPLSSMCTCLQVLSKIRRKFDCFYAAGSEICEETFQHFADILFEILEFATSQSVHSSAGTLHDLTGLWG